MQELLTKHKRNVESHGISIPVMNSGKVSNETRPGITLYRVIPDPTIKIPEKNAFMCGKFYTLTEAYTVMLPRLRLVSHALTSTPVSTGVTFGGV